MTRAKDAKFGGEGKIGYKDASRKGAKSGKFGEIGKKFSLRSLRLCSGQAWRDEEKIGQRMTLAKAQRTQSLEK